MKVLILSIILIVCTVVAETNNFTTVTAAAYLNLTLPVAVEMAAGFADGGSLGVTLVDAKTNTFHMFEDHSIGSGWAGRTNIPEQLKHLVPKENTEGRIFVSPDRPRRGGRLTSVEEGILTKAAVICLAQDWASTL